MYVYVCIDWHCTETTLIGESRFHISTPLRIEPRSLMPGNKYCKWTTGPVELCVDTVILQALHSISVRLVPLTRLVRIVHLVH
jgi:hypothetical protein